MRKKFLSLFIVMMFSIFTFVPFAKVNANDVGIVGKIATFNEVGTDLDIVAGSTDMENYINTKKNEFLVALSSSVGTVDTSKSNIDPATLFSTTSPYKYAVIDDVSSGYQMIDNTLTQTYTVDYTSFDVRLAGHNNIWATSGGKIAVLYENRNNEQADLDGSHWVSNGLVVDYLIGDPITVKAKADTNKEFVGWYVSNVQQGAEYYYSDKLVSKNINYTYQPGVTTVTGIDEPINYLTAVFKDESQIIRTTTTHYHTKVQGTLTLTGTDSFTKNYSSGDNYIDGNTTDTDVASIISNYKNDMNTIAGNYHPYPWTISEGITSYYYEAHDEITQDNQTSQISINTILEKYQIYQINGTGTTKNIKTINITLEQPFVGDNVELTPITGVCTNVGGCYTPSVKPNVSTTDPHVEVDAIFVTSATQFVGEVGVYYYSGNIERGERYKAFIFIKATDGYRINDDAVVKVNGNDPDTKFDVMNNNTETAVISEVEPQVRRVTYTLDDDRGNQIIFKDDEGIVYVFNSTDILNVTEEELQAIAADMGKDIEEIREMGTKAIEAAKKGAEGKGTLVGLYDFSVFDGNNFKEQAEGGFKIRIKMTDEMKKYNSFSIAFVKEDGTFDDLIELTQNGEYLEGILPHLSTYAIIGNVVKKSANPGTGDYINFYVTMFGLSALILGTLFYKKRIN